MAFVGVGLLTYFVHHVASSIQVSSILTRISEETAAAIDRLFPAEVGEPASARDDAPQASVLQVRAELGAPRTGYLVVIDGDALLALTQEHDLVILVACRIGDFVVDSRPLVAVLPAAPEDVRLAKHLLGCFTLAAERTVHQDALFALACSRSSMWPEGVVAKRP